MKKILVAFMFGLMAIAAQAEATFDQVQGLIQRGQYAAAEQGLEVIIKNHPNSAKAFYAMAQAQAGLGNQEKAKKALDIATGLNPTLDFAPASSVASLREAITPQVKKIESIEESHALRNFFLILVLLAGGGLVIALFMQKSRKDEEERQRQMKEMTDKYHETMKKDRESPSWSKQPEEKKQHGSDYADPGSMYAAPKAAYRGTTQTITPTPAPAPAPTYSAPPTHTTVVNNNSSSSDLLTGVILGNMMSGHDHHHETTRVVEREVVREVPAPSRSSSWDDTPSAPAPSRSSSWDDTPSTPSRSSSWDDSSSKSSSSWSSSSSSDSSSSWSDSSSSSSDSGSSWD